MKKTNDFPPQTEQRRYPTSGDLGETTAIPRSTEYDLKPAESRLRGFGFLPDEQTFKVVKKGNCP